MQWLKLYTEILDDPKIRLIAFEDRWHYVALLCCKADGLQDEREGIWEKLLRVKLGLAEVEFDSLKKRLMDVCLIDENWNPSGWDKRQGARDEKGAERQRKYREKLRKRNVTHNVTATSRVEDRSKKIEIEKDKGVAALPAAPDGINASAWAEWLEYRKQAKKKMTPATVKAQHALLARHNKTVQQQIITTSIQNGWQGLFEPKEQSNGSRHAGTKNPRGPQVVTAADLLNEGYVHAG